MSWLYSSLVISLVLIPEGFSIKCWDCISDAEKRCADPFDNSTIGLTDCNGQLPPDHLPNVTVTMCKKTKQKVEGVWRYRRSCAFLGEPGTEGDERTCLMLTGADGISMEYCTCMEDGCNISANLKTPSMLFTGLLCFTALEILI